MKEAINKQNVEGRKWITGVRASAFTGGWQMLWLQYRMRIKQIAWESFFHTSKKFPGRKTLIYRFCTVCVCYCGDNYMIRFKTEYEPTLRNKFIVQTQALLLQQVHYSRANVVDWYYKKVKPSHGAACSFSVGSSALWDCPLILFTSISRRALIDESWSSSSSSIGIPAWHKQINIPMCTDSKAY